MNDKALLKIGGACGLAIVILEAVGFAWVASARLPFDVFHLDPSEALPLISLHSRELQVLESGSIVGAVIVIPFWLALYQALKESQAAYAVLGASAGILSSIVEVAMTLPRASMLPVLARAYPPADEFSRAALYALFYVVSSTGSGLVTALRIPRIGFTSLALPRGRKFTRAVAWLGITTATLTIIEVGFWIIRGSPNDPLPVGVIAAALGRVWVILTGVWLMRFERWSNASVEVR